MIESPYAGDISRNLLYAREALHWAIDEGVAPLCSHLLYTQVLDDSKPIARAMAFQIHKALYNRIDEAWFFLDYGMSPGMTIAHDWAIEKNVPIKDIMIR